MKWKKKEFGGRKVVYGKQTLLVYCAQKVGSVQKAPPGNVRNDSNTPFTRYKRLSNRFDNRLYRVNKHPTACQTCCQTCWTTGWMFVYTIQPVVKPLNTVVKPVVQPGLTTGCIV